MEVQSALIDMAPCAATVKPGPFTVSDVIRNIKYTKAVHRLLQRCICELVSVLSLNSNPFVCVTSFASTTGEMRTAEESYGTVLHRLIQEQLRYGNPTDARTLLAIQQQALRGGGSGGGAGSPRSSLESLTQDDSQFLQMSARQEPQGQEHQGDYQHSESTMRQLYQLHGEELPTYEEAKAHSQYLASQRGQMGPQQAAYEAPAQESAGDPDESLLDLKHGHVRSLSERLMQLSLERSGARANMALSSSHSYPQLSKHHHRAHDSQGAHHVQESKGPPPEYPFSIKPPGYMLSHSQEPGHYYNEPPPAFHSQHHRYVQAQSQMARPCVRTTLTPAGVNGLVTAHNGSSSNQMELLMRENERLRKELEGYSEKTASLQKLEQEIQRISEAYEVLMKGSAKRESLEKTMRNKLEAEIKRLHDFNRDLRDRLETASKQLAAKEVEAADQNQHVFARLLEQNEEQQRDRERLEREVLQLRDSGEEQRRRLETLDRVLSSAQARGSQLEEELRRKRAYVEKVERLQRALAQLQAACEKREQLEQKLRTRLEQELKALRAQQRQTFSQGPLPSSGPSPSPLQLQLREREERILALEADITKWEQKYLEESTMRQFAMDAAATAAAQRDTTIINHSPRHSPNTSFNENLPTANHRNQEMENRIRALHTQLLEKDAVIKVLQQRSRRDQGKAEQQGLRPAKSVPSISTSAPSWQSCPLPSLQRGKVKSFSDDQTAAMSSSAVPKPPSRDCSTQSDGPPQEDLVTEEPSAAPALPPDYLEQTPVPTHLRRDSSWTGLLLLCFYGKEDSDGHIHGV
ncbi:hypothetical protein SKAU_G00057600 [Synaphobranchus kaupii]|uniref:Angiomotin C-terminal domain-containing protein n=1 Tax=Synaphobranchus kaupii TaxID=118154 RepID=A0A9Q1JAE4_SYNKA|nr:hypothetical protein SKAU_G00057600 [Synaphobranchus kaupii]